MAVTLNFRSESARLDALKRTGLSQFEPDLTFDHITQLVSHQMSAPICAVSLIGESCQWFKSRIGVPIAEVPREQAFCTIAIENDRILSIPDMLADPEFASHPMVVESPNLRAYLGCPIHTSDNIAVGTLCVLDSKARDWTEAEHELLRQYAVIVETLIRQSEQIKLLNESAGQLSELTEKFDAQATLLASVSEVAKVGGWALDLDSGSLEWTQLTREIHEVDDDFVPTLDDAIRFYKPETQAEIGAAVERGKTDGTPWDVELPLITAKGREIWVRASGKCLFQDGKPKTLVGAFQDITERHLGNAELEQRRRAAEDATNAKTRFLATMSHELRTPLNGVVALAGALAETELTPDQLEMVELLQKSGEGLNAILSDILDLSRIEEGKLSIQSEPFEFNRSVKMAVELLRLGAEQKNIAIELDLSSELDDQFRGDDVRIRQIISNLVSNAIKFTHVGKIRVTTEKYMERDGKTVIRTSVQDTGIGLRAEDQERIFRRFEQVDGTLSRAHSGVGLGLWICRLLCEDMGGSLSVVSEPGQGSTFSFELPLERVGRRALATHTRRQRSDKLRQLKVLLAEDHAVNQRIFSIILQSAGIEFDIVENGEDAVRAWRDGDYSVVLMDIQMPVKDGLTAIREIRETEFSEGWLRTPIAALSANAMAEHKLASSDAGADMHMSKPLTPETFLAGIYELADKSAEVSSPQLSSRYA